MFFAVSWFQPGICPVVVGAAHSLTSVGVLVVVVLLLGLLSDLKRLLDASGCTPTPRGRPGSNALGIFLDPNLPTLSRYVSQVPAVRMHSALEAKGPGKRFRNPGGPMGVRGKRPESSNGAPAPSLAHGTGAWLKAALGQPVLNPPSQEF